jgi:hypothetical protein
MEKEPIRDGKKQQVALEREGMTGDRERPHHWTQLSQLVRHIAGLLAIDL